MHLLFRVLVETKISLHWSNIDSLCRDAGFYNTKFGTVVTCSFWSPVSSIKWRWLSTCLSSSKKKGLLAFLLVDCTSVTWIIWNSRNLVNLFFFPSRVQILGIWKGFDLGVRKLNWTQMWNVHSCLQKSLWYEITMILFHFLKSL